MTTLKEGDKAPAFKGLDQEGQQVKLADFKGKRIILYFYPKDMTSTCTVQACNLRDNYRSLTKKGYVVIGVSPDDVKSHQKFIAKNSLPFILIADTEQKIVNDYGVWGEKSMYGRKYMGVHRTTFVINEKGIIERVILKPKSSVHAEEILKGA